MTIQELKDHCERQIKQFKRTEKIMPATTNDWKRYEEHKLILNLINAWYKVNKEIAELDIPKEDKGNYFISGIETCLDIINKHLSEVKE